MDDKVTLAQAAAAVHVHVNTVKNWRRANELKTAEKIIERGIEVWYVDLVEVEEKAIQKKSKTAQSSSQQGNVVDYSELPGPRPEGQPAAAQLPAIVPQVESFMALVERSQQPLLNRLDKLTTRNEELATEVGQLRERLRALEATQAAPQPPPAPEQPAQVQITPLAVDPPQTAQEPQKLGFWRTVGKWLG